MRYVSGHRDVPVDIDTDALREALEIGEVSLAVLFGSYGEETAGPLSDLDIAVRFDEGVARERRSRLKTELLVAIERATGVDAIDLVDLDAVGPTLGYEALARGTLLVGDSRDAVALEAEFLCKKLDFQPVVREWGEALEDRIREGSFGRP